jgi:hypothetical protein
LQARERCGFQRLDSGEVGGHFGERGASKGCTRGNTLAISVLTEACGERGRECLAEFWGNRLPFGVAF